MLLVFQSATRGDEFQFPEPPGPYVKAVESNPEATSGFRAGKPLVATTYFCWYDEASNAHIVDFDGSDALTDHPPTLQGFSYKNIDWHIAQFRDMNAAGCNQGDFRIVCGERNLLVRKVVAEKGDAREAE